MPLIDGRGRRKGEYDKVKNEVGANTISQYDYSNDGLGRRTSIANSGMAFAVAGEAFNRYDYPPTPTFAYGYGGTGPLTRVFVLGYGGTSDNRSEVTAGKRYWAGRGVSPKNNK